MNVHQININLLTIVCACDGKVHLPDDSGIQLSGVKESSSEGCFRKTLPHNCHTGTNKTIVCKTKQAGCNEILSQTSQYSSSVYIGYSYIENTHRTL